jgi:inhibitor of KinA sporulation pathway (predicted exonuclease)
LARTLDQIVVVDVESTCWEGQPPPGEESEIVEIGVCALDVATGARAEQRSILVRPERSRMSPYCTQLTTLTQEQVDSGISFAEACALLATTYQTRERTWASYGDYDRRQFERQCAAHGVRYPFGITHLNVKNLFALVYQLPREVGMDAALARLGLPLEGTHHRGGDDAWNIAAILGHLLLRARG